MTETDARSGGELRIAGRLVRPECSGELIDFDPDGDLPRGLEDHGYLLLRGVLRVDEVLAARHEVLVRLAEVGEIAEPIADGVFSGASRRAEMHADLVTFWKSVSEGPALRHVINGPVIASVMDRLFGEPTMPFGFAWLRAMVAGRASPLHVDHPYMNRGTSRLVTCWFPLGRVGIDDAPLFVVGGSHRWPDLRQRFEGHDVDRDRSRPGYIEEHALDLARSMGARLLTTCFEPGDCLIFGMFLAHGSFDHAANNDRVRLSCDTRFQPVVEPMDARFAGDDPPAHDGKGYGCLSAAQPLTAVLTKR